MLFKRFLGVGGYWSINWFWVVGIIVVDVWFWYEKIDLLLLNLNLFLFNFVVEVVFECLCFEIVEGVVRWIVVFGVFFVWKRVLEVVGLFELVGFMVCVGFWFILVVCFF